MKSSFSEFEKLLGFQGNTKMRWKNRNTLLSNHLLPDQSWYGLGDRSTRVVSCTSGNSCTRYLPNTIQSSRLKHEWREWTIKLQDYFFFFFRNKKIPLFFSGSTKEKGQSSFFHPCKVKGKLAFLGNTSAFLSLVWHPSWWQTLASQ